MRRWGLISPASFCYAEIKKQKRRKSLLTTIMIGKALATVTENETLTSGMINAKIKFEFSADWHSEISRTAIFTAGDVTKVVLDSYWENNVCSIPQECLEKSDEILMVGVYGADNANTVAIPTVWATVGKIRKGYEGYEDVSTGTLPIWAQVQSAAAQSAQAAKDAQTAAESAKAAAVTAGASAESANASAQSAKSAAESAKAAAQTAQSKAETANTSAQTAKADAEAANTSAQSAKTDAESAKSAAAGSAQSAGASAQSAQASSKLSESWAVGGTGTRTGEDTNNAKYWAMAAQGVAGGGVSSFNGRSGAVAPQTGDYTAAMVGADAQGAAETVQDNLNTHAQNTAKHITAAERTAWNGKSGKADSFTVTLTAAGWSAGTQAVSNSKFIASGYAYTVCPAGDSFKDYAEAMIYADNVTTAGRMSFHCDVTPTKNLTVNILRTEATA